MINIFQMAWSTNNWKLEYNGVTKIGHQSIVVNMPEALTSITDGWRGTKTVGWGSLVVRIRQLLKSQGWAINGHRVKPQANKCFGTKLNINEHLTGGVMSEQLGQCHGCPHDLVQVNDFLRMLAMTDGGLLSSKFLPPQDLCNLCKTGWRAQGLVVCHGLVWHKLPGMEW